MLTCPTLKTGVRSCYAGGLFYDNFNGHPLWEHSGADAAYRAHMLRIPDSGLDIVIFSNTDNIPLSIAARQIAAIALGEEIQPAAQHDLDYEPDTDTDFTGQYYSVSEIPFLLEVSKKNGQYFIAEPLSYQAAPLTHICGNCFCQGHLQKKIFLGEKAGIQDLDGSLVPLVRCVKSRQGNGLKNQYIGVYKSTELETVFAILEKNGELFLCHRRNGETVLVPTGEGCFLAGGRFNCVITFNGQNDGETNGFRISSERSRNIFFQKIE